MDQVVGYTSPRGQGCETIFEDARAQYVLDDEGRRVYGIYMIPEEHCLRTSPDVRPVRGIHLCMLRDGDQSNEGLGR